MKNKPASGNLDRREFVKTGVALSPLLAAPSLGFAQGSPKDKLKTYIQAAFPDRINPATGSMAHPYIDPGAAYKGLCWDWDAYFCLRGLSPWKSQLAEVSLGCVRNFMDFQAPDGSIPYALIARKEKPSPNRNADSPANSMKPLLAQFVLMAYDYSGEISILEEALPSIQKHCLHWEETQMGKFGLFTFRSHRGSGVDDHPAVFCRPFNSSADVYLNSLFVMEYRAAGKISGILNKPQLEKEFESRATGLAEAINTYLWDPVDEIYYNLDVGYASPGRINTQPEWPLHLKVKSWTAFMPLWASVADKEKAKLLVEKHLLNGDEFWTDFGIRSLARNEPAYEIKVGYNPSCWRGPIWVVNNYLMYEGLQNYGYARESTQLAANIRNLLSRDINENNCLHEYYHPDTGEGLTHPGFLNWNTLAAIMV